MILRPVTPENYDSVLDLRVSPEQERFVAPVTKSLADAFVYESAQVRIGYEEETPVGFVLVFPFDRANQPVVNIVRLLIDQRYQQRGLGARCSWPPSTGLAPSYRDQRACESRPNPTTR